MNTEKGVYRDETGAVVEYSNPKIKRNNLIFAIMTILMQILTGLIYGFLIKPLPNGPNIGGDITPIVLTVGYALLTIVGFGLLFSYMRYLVWSGLGFSFLITALTIQFFFLMNAAFAWAQLQRFSSRGNLPYPQETPTDLNYYYFTMSQSTLGFFGSTILQAFKASMANVIAFSAVLGRAGLLQAWLLVLISTVGYELNRTIISRYTYDGPGTLHIFLYAGTVGLVSSFLLSRREKKIDTFSGRHTLFTGNKFSGTMALIGTIFVWVFLPLLGSDPTFYSNNASIYLAPLNIVFGLIASTLTTMCMSALMNGRLSIRDIVYGPIAGGIAVATAGNFITNPVYALLLGTISGGLTTLFFNIRRGKNSNSQAVLYTYPVAMFFLNGFLGSIWAAWSNAVIWNNPNTFTGQNVFTGYVGLDYSFWGFLMGLLTIAFGIGFGLVVGVAYLIFGVHGIRDHFTDFTYWVYDDGISYATRSPLPPVGRPASQVEMEFYEGDNQIKNIHAYL